MFDPYIIFYYAASVVDDIQSMGCIVKRVTAHLSAADNYETAAETWSVETTQLTSLAGRRKVHVKWKLIVCQALMASTEVRSSQFTETYWKNSSYSYIVSVALSGPSVSFDVSDCQRLHMGQLFIHDSRISQRNCAEVTSKLAIIFLKFQSSVTKCQNWTYMYLIIHASIFQVPTF